MSVRPPASNVGRFTGIVLGFVVFVCVAMIGGTGYLKYQLDRAETIMAAPDNALGSDQDQFARLRRDLGYGGFLGLAQNYALTHDASGFAEMKAHIKSADDIVAHLPDKTPAEARHELSAIVIAFDAAMQKINAPAGDMAGEFTVSDLVPLYAALPILDARVVSGNAEIRLAAQNQIQFWAMMLTLASWCSLILAAACTAGIYLTLRDKHSAPMRALAQSIQNMARGDMRTAIWGTERQDMIGELARAVDIARYHFSHLPDLSLLSEQGPVRMRFEGGTRSLFEAMMKAISRDSENIREHSSSLVAVVNSQKESITHLSEKVEDVLKNILQRGQNGDYEIGKAIHEMLGSAENLKNAHAHSFDQLNRLIPSLENRAAGLAEIAHITGKQIGQTLQALTISESGMKANAEQAKNTLSKLSSTADDLSERLFGAINLLQASGKVLAETTEDLKARWGEEGMGQKQTAADLAPLTYRLEQISSQLTSMQTKLGEQGGIQADIVAVLEQQINQTTQIPSNPLFDTEMITLLTQQLDHIGERIALFTTNIPLEIRQNMRKEIDNLSAHIDATQSQLVQIIDDRSRNGIVPLDQKIDDLRAEMIKSESSSTISENLLQQMQDHWYQMASQIEASRISIDKILQQKVVDKLSEFEQKLEATKSAAEATRFEIVQPPPPQSYTLPPELQQQLLDQWFQMSAQLEASRANMIDSIAEQIDKMETRLAGRNANSLSKTAADYVTQRQIEQQTQILSELVSTLSILDTHMQQMKAEMRARA